MFTGIVAELGEVEAVQSGSEGARIRVRTALADDLRAGDSIAVSGACLTAASAGQGVFEADVMNQTLALTTLGAVSSGDRVNLELALRATDRLGGHVVQGHVDGTGTVADLQDDGFAKRLRVELPDQLLSYVVERGSIAIEGVSLTISELGEGWIEVSLIPETLERTTLGGLSPGDAVNVECDVLARYVRRLIEHAGDRTSPW
ncbi:MAG: riboflavin synthase [Actinomycetota bacterium]|nr:riboflavin synthase [Actinomycetota bacterium]